MKKVTRKIEVDLTDQEIVELGNEAAKLQSELTIKEFDFNEYKKNTKRKLDDLKSVIVDLLSSINRGTKEINVDCDEIFNLHEKMFHYYLDEKEVDCRAMTCDEFDYLVKKECTEKINELNWNTEYYYGEKLIASYQMTPDQIEKIKQNNNILNIK